MPRISFSTDHVKSFAAFADFEKKYGGKCGSDFLKPIWEQATGKKADAVKKEPKKKVITEFQTAIVEPQNITEHESSNAEESEEDGEESSKSHD